MNKHLDTFIFGQQGAGKTTHALRMVSSFLQEMPTSDFRGCASVYRVTPEDFADRIALAKLIATIGAPVVIFDGVIVTPDDLALATDAMRVYRLHKPKGQTLAVYVVQGDTSDFISCRNDR